MVINFNKKIFFKAVGTETIPAHPDRYEAPVGFNYIVQPNRNFVPVGMPVCRRISAVLPKTDLGSIADDFGFVENATRRHHNYNGSLVHLEMSVTLKNFKSNHTGLIRHSKKYDLSEFYSGFFWNDSGCRNLQSNNRRLSLEYRKPTLKGRESDSRHRKPKLNNRELGSRCGKSLLLCRETGLPCRKTLLRHGKRDLLHRKTLLRLLVLGFRLHSFIGMHCLSAHWKNFCSARAEFNYVTPGFKLNFWNGMAHKIITTNPTLKKQKERRYKENWQKN